MATYFNRAQCKGMAFVIKCITDNKINTLTRLHKNSFILITVYMELYIGKCNSLANSKK